MGALVREHPRFSNKNNRNSQNSFFLSVWGNPLNFYLRYRRGRDWGWPGIEPSTLRLIGARCTTEPTSRAPLLKSGRILVQKWQSTAPKMAGFCPKNGRILPTKWQDSAQKVAGFCPKSGRILPKKWQESAQKMAGFCPESGRILPKKWQDSAQKVSEFCPKSGRVLPEIGQNPGRNGAYLRREGSTFWRLKSQRPPDSGQIAYI